MIKGFLIWGWKDWFFWFVALTPCFSVIIEGPASIAAIKTGAIYASMFATVITLLTLFLCPDFYES